MGLARLQSVVGPWSITAVNLTNSPDMECLTGQGTLGSTRPHFTYQLTLCRLLDEAYITVWAHVTQGEREKVGKVSEENYDHD